MLFIINGIVITATVLIHYEALLRLSIIVSKAPIRHRFRIVICIFGALIAHTIEIWIFAFAYFGLFKSDGFGTMQGADPTALMDCVYFSFVNYTSLGYGDVIPIGSIRYLAGLEALTGLVLIAWTASFMFYLMQQYWDEK